ncbi:MAG: DUF1499 domain-containing protein, partial [Desulfatitalea sp.]|nr:DUF1499 domain-containing protein [Desulfatitalea sp.]
MKIFIIILILVTAAAGLLMVVLSCSGQAPSVSLVNGKFRPCPDTPNCVSSDSETGNARIDPLAFSGNADEAWQRVQQVVVETGGQIQSREADYIWATYTSRLFRFVDDLELRLDRGAGVVHVRSA